jgi:hypothetical protein
MNEIISYKICAVKVRNAKLRNYLSETNDPVKAYNEFLETFGDVYEVNIPLKRKQNNEKK